MEDNKLIEYKRVVNKLSKAGVLGKVNYLLQNLTIRKKDPILAREVDSFEGGNVNPDEFYKNFKELSKTRGSLPSLRFISRILDIGISEGPMKLIQLLKNNKLKTIFKDS